MRRLLLAAMLMVSAAWLAPVAVGAQETATAAPTKAPAPGVDSVLDARVKAIASRLRCPVCQGESIQDSPAELSAQMKTLVREQLYEGRTESEVLDYFQAKYGQWILLEPRAEGINLLVYGLPVAFIVLGGIGIMTVVKKWTRPPSAGGIAASNASDRDAPAED